MSREPSTTPRKSQPRAPRHVRRRVAVGAGALALLTIAVVSVSALHASTSADASNCAGQHQLRVAVTPEIAPVLSGVLQVDKARKSCGGVQVVPIDSAEVAAQLGRTGE